MELDEIKSQWKTFSKKGQDLTVNQTQINEIISMQSKSLISHAARRLRAKARTGTLVGLLTLLIGLATLFIKNDQTSIFDAYVPHHMRYYMMTFMSLFILFIAWYNQQQYLILKRLEGSSTNIREALLDTIDRLHRVMKASILSDTIGAPIIVLWITYIQLYWGSSFILDTRLITLLSITIGSIPIIFLIARQGQRGKYGAHIQELEHCLTELNSSHEN